jgi:hypothetical protein
MLFLWPFLPNGITYFLNVSWTNIWREAKGQNQNLCISIPPTGNDILKKKGFLPTLPFPFQGQTGQNLGLVFMTMNRSLDY